MQPVVIVLVIILVLIFLGVIVVGFHTTKVDHSWLRSRSTRLQSGGGGSKAPSRNDREPKNKPENLKCGIAAGEKISVGELDTL